MPREYGNKFDAPIPGQSLTMAQGAMPFEQPVKFADPEEAAEYVFDRITQPKRAAEMKALLKGGTVSAEAISNTILRQGFNEGLWTPDTALLISEVVLGQVVAVGKRMGVKNIKIFNDREAGDMAGLFAPGDEVSVPEGEGTVVESGVGEVEPKSDLGIMGLLSNMPEGMEHHMGEAPVEEGAQ